jgi:hypothetical protein
LIFVKYLSCFFEIYQTSASRQKRPTLGVNALGTMLEDDEAQVGKLSGKALAGGRACPLQMMAEPALCA